MRASNPLRVSRAVSFQRATHGGGHVRHDVTAKGVHVQIAGGRHIESAAAQVKELFFRQVRHGGAVREPDIVGHHFQRRHGPRPALVRQQHRAGQLLSFGLERGRERTRSRSTRPQIFFAAAATCSRRPRGGRRFSYRPATSRPAA